MNRISAFALVLLTPLSMPSAAEDKPDLSAARRVVILHKCHITLIDHVILASDRTGILKSVDFKEGDLVAKGARLALIDDSVAQANLVVAQKKASNRAEVEFAEVSKVGAEKEYERLIKTNKLAAESGAKAVAPLEIDKAQLAFDKAAVSVKHAEHELALNILNAKVTAAELDTYSVPAVFDGVVTRIYKKKGEAVRQGDPVAEIINTDRVRVEGKVALADLSLAKMGAKVLVRLAIPDLDLQEEKENFEGRITFVDVVSNPITNETRVYAEIPNRNNILRAGLMADMEIEIEGSPRVTRLLDSNAKISPAAVENTSER